MRIRYSLILIFFSMLFKDTSHAKALFMSFLSTKKKNSRFLSRRLTWRGLLYFFIFATSDLNMYGKKGCGTVDLG